MSIWAPKYFSGIWTFMRMSNSKDADLHPQIVFFSFFIFVVLTSFINDTDYGVILYSR
jgi:hypothetical protein